MFDSSFTFSSANKELNAVEPTPSTEELLRKALLVIKRSNSMSSIIDANMTYLVIVSCRFRIVVAISNHALSDDPSVSKAVKYIFFNASNSYYRETLKVLTERHDLIAELYPSQKSLS